MYAHALSCFVIVTDGDRQWSIQRGTFRSLVRRNTRGGGAEALSNFHFWHHTDASANCRRASETTGRNYLINCQGIRLFHCNTHYALSFSLNREQITWRCEFWTIGSAVYLCTRSHKNTFHEFNDELSYWTAYQGAIRRYLIWFMIDSLPKQSYVTFLSYLHTLTVYRN